MRKKEKKQNRITRIAALTLMGALVTTSMLSTTLAKYTRTLSGTDSARVAKFDFEASVKTDVDAAGVPLTTAGAAIKLFSTSYDNGESVNTVLRDASDTTNKLVAPGVSGWFQYSFTGVNEVATRLSLTINEEGDGTVPIFYEYDGIYYANDAAIAAYEDELTPTTGEVAAGTATLWINISDSDSNYPDFPDYTELDEDNYGGDLEALALASAEAIGDSLGVDGVIAPGTSLSNTLATGLDKVNWCWPFEVVKEDSSLSATDAGAILVAAGTYGTNISDGDETEGDTALGLVGTAVITLNMDATLTQVD